MNLVQFVQTIKFYCSAKGVKPTVACREAGVGQSFINNMELKGSVPSVEKVEMLAHYLGVTVSDLLGETKPRAPAVLETFPETAVLRDSAVTIRPDDFRRLSLEEMDMVLAYRRATEKERRTIDGILSDYKKGTTAETG